MDKNKFKFRAWDKKRMHYFTFDSIYNGGIAISSGVVKYNSSYECEIITTKSVKLSDCEITQSTGETDKNGKIIYEGDIFMTHEGVYFQDFKINEPYIQHVRKDWYKFYVVAGNIFENKELLIEGQL